MIELIFSFFPRFLIEEEVANLDKCTISGNITQVEIIQNEGLCETVYIDINGDDGKYNTFANLLIVPSGMCDIDAFFIYGGSNFPLPEIGNEVNILVDKNSYQIVSEKKIGNGEYSTQSGISKGNFEVCEPNTGEDTEIQVRFRKIHTYLNELSYNKPRTAKKLLSTLEDLNLSTYSQETNILVLYAREILKMLIGIL